MRLRRHLRPQRLRLQRRRKNTRTTDGGDLGAEVARLRSESHGDVAIFGSSDLTVTLLEQGLVDELRILLHYRPWPSDRATNDQKDTNARTRPATTLPWPRGRITTLAGTGSVPRGAMPLQLDAHSSTEKERRNPC
ncbi:dihydrofolate reductase family protein [Streptomyces sp. A73]|nr:dihydrofolate reductase family protein [Streptomyces sp. RK75]MBQ1160698.1 dihydrofolate reductase family protein [Streptomyces sp. A73]